MINNDKQYKSAKTQIELFQESLDNLSLASNEYKDIHPQLIQLNKTAIETQLKELINEVHEYEELKVGNIIITEIKSLEEFPLALIKARIANNLTQSELAANLGLKMQQIQKYEAERYSSASLKTLIRIASGLNISISGDVQIKPIEAPEILDVKNYPFKQMFQRNWFGNYVGSLNEAIKDSGDLIANFFEAAGIPDFKYSLTKKLVRSGSILNEFALNAWYARVLLKAKEQRLTTPFDKALLDAAWLKNLAELSKDSTNLKQVTLYLKNSGIRFVIEPQLDGTFLDGAALLMDNINPVIALTLRYDRLDNFWFVLFHEIAHIILHLSGDLNAIFDDLDVKIDGIEKEADELALNSLISNEIWRKSLVRFRPSEKAIINQAEILNIHPALVAGRIRRETGLYHQFTELIGANMVRKQFTHDLNN
jgi:HTH-type transcriptional regulator/antitoxin HigA